MNIETSKITSKGQITLPVAVRRKLNLQTGDKVVFIEDDVGFRICNSSGLTVSVGTGPKDASRNNGPVP
jgi:AbrB family looped-hinge helix DNA binding protein